MVSQVLLLHMVSTSIQKYYIILFCLLAETYKTIGNGDGDGDVTATTVKVGREEFRKTSKLKQKLDELENLKKLREESLVHIYCISMNIYLFCTFNRLPCNVIRRGKLENEKTVSNITWFVSLRGRE